jgi:SAM-dependent methyltransferase
VADYIHGYSAAEQQRLSRMQTILNDAELRELDLRGVRTLLDVGAGLGQLTRAFAKVLGPGGRVVGVERDARQRAEAERQAAAAGERGLVELRAGDALDLPLRPDEVGTFDLVHTRFLLEHVPDPLGVVREMARAVRPGGRVVLVDDDHELLVQSPECAPLARYWRAYWESYRDRGLDPLVGRRLPSLLREAGLRPVRVATVFYGAVQGDALFAAVVDNLVGVLESAADGMAASGRAGRGDLAAALEALDAWRREPAATLWYSLPLAEGVRPE